MTPQPQSGGSRRADLLALTPDALAALTNRGLVKRATREVDRGLGPAIEVSADGTVTGEYPDGIHTCLPGTGGWGRSSCSCPAVGACRHQIAVVLAYQRRAAEDSPTPRSGEREAVVRWSPGEFTDRDLVASVGTRALSAARRTARTGFTARIHRPNQREPVASVELSGCVVRFLVPHDLSYAHTEAAARARGKLIALAVRAFQEADRAHPDVDEVTLDIGGGSSGRAVLAGMDAAQALVEEILLDGVVNTAPGLATGMARARRDLESAGLRWPLLAVAELDDQLRGYAERSARYRPETVAYLLAEVEARRRAGIRGERTSALASPGSRVLGTEVAASTPLRRLHLTSLGCRVSPVTGRSGRPERLVEAYLADPESSAVLVWRRSWPVPDDRALTGRDLARQRAGSLPVRLLASGEVVSESAVRSASRSVRFASRQLAITTAAPFADHWAELPERILARDLAASARDMAESPPRMLRPRIEAEFVRAVPIENVCSVGYSPGDQSLEAVIEDGRGNRALVAATYRSVCPGALEALACALAGLRGRPRFVSGTLRLSQGGIVIDPMAVVVDGDLVVCDLAEGGESALPVLAEEAVEEDPIRVAVSQASLAVIDMAHHGLRHLPEAFAQRLAEAVSGLSGVGMRTTAASIEALAGRLGPDPGPEAVTAWVSAQILLTVVGEHM